MENILISACLLGQNCRYDGGHNFSARTDALKQKYNLIPICPEVLGGLPTPRNPQEQIGERVFNNKGTDVTEQFSSGAKACLTLAKKNNCRIAILKARSPSCGVGQIYDGTFSKTLADGNGVTAKLLQQNGIKVYTEENFEI
jgi:uncharacterized protein YbbK (DUF523 family)